MAKELIYHVVSVLCIHVLPGNIQLVNLVVWPVHPIWVSNWLDKTLPFVLSYSWRPGPDLCYCGCWLSGLHHLAATKRGLLVSILVSIIVKR